MTELPPPAAGCAACAARDQVIAELGRAVEELRGEVAELRRRLGRNSRNSSMPPSADDLPGRVPPRRGRGKGGTGRERGKQPGAPGAAMSWAEPDEIVDHRPAGACAGCRADLAEAADLGVARSLQQLEVPLMTARRIQDELHQARGLSWVSGGLLPMVPGAGGVPVAPAPGGPVQPVAGAAGWPGDQGGRLPRADTAAGATAIAAVAVGVEIVDLAGHDDGLTGVISAKFM